MLLLPSRGVKDVERLLDGATPVGVFSGMSLIQPVPERLTTLADDVAVWLPVLFAGAGLGVGRIGVLAALYPG